MPTKAIHGITVAHFYETYVDKLQLELVTDPLDPPDPVSTQRLSATDVANDGSIEISSRPVNSTFVASGASAFRLGFD